MTGAKITSLMVYNPTYGPKEGQEHLKLLYYYPENELADIKVNNVGLCEALVQFSKTYSPNQPCESLHTQKHRHVFYEAESDFWLVMTSSNPYKEILRDGKPAKEYHEEEVKDILLSAMLKRAYYMFRIFYGSFESTLQSENIEVLKTKLKEYFSKYIPDINLQYADILDVHCGVQYFPLDRPTYLKLCSFVNRSKSGFRQIKYTMVLYNSNLVWSGLNKEDTRIMFTYIVTRLLPSSSESNSALSSYLTRDDSYGRFLTGAEYFHNSTDRHITTVYVTSGASREPLFLITYQVLQITFCMFIEGKPPAVDTFRKLDSFLGRPLISFSTTMEAFQQKISESTETSYKFIYFNRLSLASRSSCHTRDVSGYMRCSLPAEVMKVILGTCKDFSKKDADLEVITKASSEYWVVGKRLEQHECYVVVNQKNANLIEVNEEVKRICASHITSMSFYE